MPRLKVHTHTHTLLPAVLGALAFSYSCSSLPEKLAVLAPRILFPPAPLEIWRAFLPLPSPVCQAPFPCCSLGGPLALGLSGEGAWLLWGGGVAGKPQVEGAWWARGGDRLLHPLPGAFFCSIAKPVALATEKNCIKKKQARKRAKASPQPLGRHGLLRLRHGGLPPLLRHPLLVAGLSSLSA